MFVRSQERVGGVHSSEVTPYVDTPSSSTSSVVDRAKRKRVDAETESRPSPSKVARVEVSFYESFDINMLT